jgi:N-acylneuraminate cytidylyltransferase
MNILYLIPARSGSKGVISKNIKPLRGKPLIYYTLEQVTQIATQQNICVSTDSEEIKSLVESFGQPVSFIRPDSLARDSSGMHEVILHALKYYNNLGIKYDVIALLQPTSPFRQASHIQQAINLYSPEIDMIVSVKHTRANPYYNLFEESPTGYLIKAKTGNYKTRQECPEVWEFNGAIYIINAQSVLKKPMSSFNKVTKFVMDFESSLDIDTEMDFMFAEFLLAQQKI